MVIILVFLVIFTILWAPIYNATYANETPKVDFWKDFTPQILATGFGMLGSFALAAALWVWQQKGQDTYNRAKTLKNLEFEIDEDLKILTENAFILDVSWDQKKRAEDYLAFTGKLAKSRP